MVMPKATTEACSRLMLPVTSGRREVRRISASMSRSTTSLMAAVPPLTKPMPISACNSVHDSNDTPDLAAAKYAPAHAVITIRVVTRALVSVA